MNEITESVLDQEKKDLSPDVFIPGKKVMKEKVKNFIVDTAYKWIESQGFKKENIKKVIFIGSMAGYSYTEVSDIDINLEVDIPDQWIEDNWKLLPNGNNIPGTKHPVNYYLVTKTNGKAENTEKADAVYDVLNDKFIREEKKGEKKVNYNYAFEIARFFLTGIDNRIQEYEIDKKELEYLEKLNPETDTISQDEIDKKVAQKKFEIMSDLDAIYLAHKVLVMLRHAAFDGKELEMLIGKENKNNFSFENLVYKIIMDRLGYEEVFKKYEDIREKWQTKE